MSSTGSRPPRHPAVPGPLVVAHRGDHAASVENSLEAVLRAVALGADAVEVDVRCTLDGVPVLLHDATLARVHGSRHRVSLLTRDRLARIAPAVPTLADTLDALRTSTTPLLLDVRSIRAAHAALATVTGSAGGRHSGLVPTGGVWFCGRPRALAWLRQAAPQARLLLSWRRPSPPSQALVAAVRPDWFNPWHRLLDPAVVEAWRAGGVPVATWTVDDPARRAELTGWGVEALTTNDLRAALAERRTAAQAGALLRR